MDSSNPYLKRIELVDILGKLPDIKKIEWDKDFINSTCDIFICALGFEDRCLSISKRLADNGVLKCTNAIIFEYSTNIEDNLVNKPYLITNIQKFCSKYVILKCDEDDFLKNCPRGSPIFSCLFA